MFCCCLLQGGQILFLSIFAGGSKRDGTLELVFRQTDPPTYMLLYKGLSMILKQEESHIILSVLPKEIKVNGNNGKNKF